MAPRDLILFKPGLLHSMESTELPFSFYCVHFDLYVPAEPAGPAPLVNANPTPPRGPQLKLARADFHYPDHSAVADLGEFYRMQKILGSMVEVHRQKFPGYLLELKSLFSLFFLAVYSQGAGSSRIPSEQRWFPPEVNQVIQEISRSPGSAPSLTELARKVHLQPSSLSHLYKRYTGCSIASFIRLSRIALARHLLLETPLKMSAIAAETGFYDLHHFSRVFKELEGISPSQFRNMKF
ncbi:MAG TPA: hypothetical protein DD727_01580 [Clostridiales bacterium]|nr:hypothetical protein [Clostridiales bacterium]